MSGHLAAGGGELHVFADQSGHQSGRLLRTITSTRATGPTPGTSETVDRHRRHANTPVRKPGVRVTLTVCNDVGQSSRRSNGHRDGQLDAGCGELPAFSPTAPEYPIRMSSSNASASVPSSATFAWNFGDASTGTGVTPTHRYVQAGTYTVTLTVTNSNGQSATTSRTVPVSATSPQVVASFCLADVACRKSGCLLQCLGLDPEHRDVRLGFRAMGDGLWRHADLSSSHVGHVPVTLRVNNSLGQSARRRNLSVTAVAGPTASFSFSPASPATGQADVFVNGSPSTSATGTTITSYVGLR